MVRLPAQMPIICVSKSGWVRGQGGHVFTAADSNEHFDC